jgi:septum site-determining protein MinC
MKAAVRPRASNRSRDRLKTSASAAATPSPSMRFRRRSFSAIVLGPEPPVAKWLADLDAFVQQSPRFFVGQPVILNLSRLPLSKPDLAALIADLHGRGIRIIALEGADASVPGLGLPPVVNKGRPARAGETPEGTAPPAPREPAFLLHEGPVRSGQTVIFPEGDITILGSVGSGAEVVAGGSIHIYGALRGRAMAGVNGHTSARIYCQKIEAELLAIDGFYQTADDIDAALRGQPAQAFLQGNTMRITALN